MISQLNLTLWAWIESFRGLRRGAVWPPVLIMIGLHLAALLLMTQFYRPVLSWLLGPILQAAVGPAAAPMILHYPNFYFALPQLFGRVNLGLDWIAGSLLFGGATLIVWLLATGGDHAGSWVQTRRAWVKLLVLRAPISLLPALLYYILPGGDALHGNALRAVRYGAFLVGVVIEAIFLYGPLALLVGRRSLLGALRETVSLSVRVPLASFLIVFVPNLVHLPIAAALRRTDSVVMNLSPEAVIGMLALSVLAYVGVAYFTLASAVRIYGARAGAGGGGTA